MSVRILQGDCREILRTLPDAAVQCCVTSPPYYGLRDYGVAGQIGLEQSPAEYVVQMVEVFREVRRVLRDDGTVWLNLGDSYATGAGKASSPGGGAQGRRFLEAGPSGYRGSRPDSPKSQVPDKKNPDAKIPLYQPNRMPIVGLKPKDLIGIPWRVAFALQDDGWWLRQDNIWAKRNCMPESVRDRTTRAHEYVFMLTKAERYFYDAVAIEEDSTGQDGAAANFARSTKDHLIPGQAAMQHRTDRTATGDTGKRNKRSVWWMATQPFPEAHFATFPPELPEICIKAGTSERGCCARCGAAWVRQTEKPTAPLDVFTKRNAADDGLIASGRARVDGVLMGAGQKLMDWRNANPERTTGWLPSCSCDAGEPIPCTVLDPFAGAFTTALVADRLGRACIGIELNPEYCDMARRRITKDAGMFAEFAA